MKRLRDCAKTAIGGVAFLGMFLTGLVPPMQAGDFWWDPGTAGSLIFNTTGDTLTGTTLTLGGTLQMAMGGIYSSGSFGNIVQTRAASPAALIFDNPGAMAFSVTGSRTLTLGGDSIGDNQIELQLVDSGVDAFFLNKNDPHRQLLHHHPR